MKLDIGAGRSRVEGFTPVDIFDYGDNIVFDLEGLSRSGHRLPLEDNSVSEFRMTHVLEHIHDTLGLMQELYRVAIPGARLHIATPFAFSEESIEDQTHVKHFTFHSFCFFSQPVYANASYGYTADWHHDEIKVTVPQSHMGMPESELRSLISRSRNIGKEISVTLEAIKPARPQALEYVTVPKVTFIPI